MRNIQSLFKEIQDFITYAKKSLSKKMLQRNPGTARSINSFLESYVLTWEDREYICGIVKPIGWCAKFEQDVELTEEEQITKSKIVNSIKKYPTVKVNFELRLSQCAILISFQRHFDVRPRTFKDSFDSVMCAQRPLEMAKNDPSHELHYHARQICINQPFTSALHTMFSQYDVLIKFFDQKHTWQVFKLSLTHNLQNEKWSLVYSGLIIPQKIFKTKSGL